MQIHFTGRQMDVTESIRSYAEARLRKLGRFIDGITDIHVIVAAEKYRQIAEVNVRARGNKHLTSVEESNDIYASIAQAIDKIAAQARKEQAKRIGKKRRASRREPEASGVFSVLAREDGGDADEPRRIVESRRFPIKPLSVEEAVVEIEDEGAEFLVFRNATSDRVNVLYRRPDGNYGLIDPEGR